MISIMPLDFLGQGALLEPVDVKLHDAAYAFALKELSKGKEVDFSKFAKVWVGLKDEKVLGIAGYVLKPDIPLLRATDAEVLRALCYRMNDFFSDSGARGKEAFIYIGDEKPEQRCPEWKSVLKEFGAKSAQRFSVEVR